MSRHALRDAIRFGAPPRPMPPAVPPVPPLRCRTCDEVVEDDDGKPRACRCERRSNWSLVLLLLLPLAFVIALLVLR